MSLDCLVVGGGVVGLMSARELARSGLRVGLVERGECGREASWAGGGLLSPLFPWRMPPFLTELGLWGQRWYPELAGNLMDETGEDAEYVCSGMLVLGSGEEEQALAWGQDHEFQVEVVPEATILRWEPNVRPGFHWGVWLADVGQIRPPRLLRALRLSLLHHRVRMIERTEVRKIIVEHGRAVGVETSEGPLYAGRVVVAAGAWSDQLLQPHGSPLSIEPVRGQIVLFAGPPRLLRRVLEHGDVYLIPRRDGRVLAGSTVERVGFDKSTTGEAELHLLTGATEMVPALGACQIEHHWAGLRPGSPHGVPYIGPHPQVEGLFVNAGHFRNGLLFAPGSAWLVADQILERQPLVDPAPFQWQAHLDRQAEAEGREGHA